MSCFPEVEEFVQEHHQDGELTVWTTSPTRKGYRVRIACPCGVLFERWILPQDAGDDLLLSGLLAFPS